MEFRRAARCTRGKAAAESKLACRQKVSNVKARMAADCLSERPFRLKPRRRSAPGLLRIRRSIEKAASSIPTGPPGEKKA